jgi:asparagine synthase (glutamine-hydrolysing)
MCGIAGVMPLGLRPAERSVITRMTDAMVHRGPDASGFYINDSIALGHRRLSIIDLSDAAGQPFTDSSGRFHLVFNGELYNFRDVRNRIKDHTFQSTGDTEVLAEAYARIGINCVHDFKGMFAFAVWDDQLKELCLVRDRMGVKPLYYFVTDEFLVFASEIRALLQSGLVARKLNKKAVMDYLSFQSASSPSSMIEGVQQLEAGHYLKCKDGKITIKQYWNLTEQKINFEYADKKQTARRIKELLTNSVECRLISDVPLGAFLSGGIDSSTIVGLMASLSNSRPQTFNISFEEKDYDESRYAEMVAKKFNTNHHRILLKPTVMLDELDNTLNAMDAPSGDGINTYVVAKAVKKAGITVALSGLGGDELFAGYPFFKKFMQLRKVSPLWAGTNMLRKVTSRLTSVSSSSTSVKARQILEAETVNIEDLYPVFRHVFSHKQIAKLTGGVNADYITETERKLNEHASVLHTYPLLSQVSIAEFMGYTQQTLLKDTDQMSMAVSLEVREPFFDHELVSFILSIPDEYKNLHYSKQLLIESLGGLLPNEIIQRKKQGFTFPWNKWLRVELKDFCEKYIRNLSHRDFIQSAELLKWWKLFLQGSRQVRWMDIWLLVVLEYWMERNDIH